MERKILALVLSLFTWTILTSSGYAQKEYSKDYNEEFTVEQGAILKTESSFSELVISTWNKNSIQVKITAVVKAKNEKNAEDLIDKLTVKIRGASDEVYVSTDVDNTWNWGGKNKADQLEVEIHIHAPAHVRLRVSHSFGDVEIDSFSGNSRVEVEYGALEAESLSGIDNELEVGFGSGQIESFGGGEIDFQYGEGQIGSISHSTDIECAYGDIEIESIAMSCKSLEVDCDYGDIKVGLKKRGNYEFEGSSSFGNVRIPDGVEPSSSSDEYFSSEVRARSGSGSDPTHISAEANFGDIKFHWND